MVTLACRVASHPIVVRSPTTTCGPTTAPGPSRARDLAELHALPLAEGAPRRPTHPGARPLLARYARRAFRCPRTPSAGVSALALSLQPTIVGALRSPSPRGAC